MEELGYVIYCRKSTDESSEKQQQSIPDQIKACKEYAKREWIKIKEKLTDFSMFENEYEIEKENNEEDINNRRIYLETRNLFIIKEQETGKIAHKRKKWRALINLIKAWKVKWLLSYSPDRQSRNMFEWWELIDLVDQWLINLKYTNFHFENSPSWKMMLWIWFVFSKQYSDKLSEDVIRWNKSKLSSWKSLWNYKHWYIINEQWFHEPHPHNFNIIKEAFQMKLNWISETKILQFINASWYKRDYKKSWESKEMSKSVLNSMLRDDFYYWKFIRWDNTIDLIETSTYYKPMITSEEFELLNYRYENNSITKSKLKKKDIYEDIAVFDNNFILTHDNYHLTFSLPNIKRFYSKIKLLNEKWIIKELKDIIKPNQINYRCANSNSKYYNISYSMEDIDKVILNALEGFKVSDDHYKIYVNYVNKKLDEVIEANKEKVSSINLQIWRLKSKKNQYIKNNMHIKEKNTDEYEVYNNEKNEYDRKIEFLRKEINEIDTGERNQILELEMFIDLLNNAKEYYKKATYVQKKKIVKILFLNIKIDQKKRLRIQVKPELETCFNPSWLGM